jgi:hypothetical protein
VRIEEERVARYWAVSPNIGNQKKNAKSLGFWIKTTLESWSVYMGHNSDDQIGQRFAQIAANDVILIAHGSMENHGANRRLVACGRVQENFPTRDQRVDDSALRYRHSQYATLSPFLSLDEDPTRSRIPLRETLHDGDPQPRAVFELTPEDRNHPGNKALCHWLDRKLNRAPAQQENAGGNQATSVIANSVRIDTDVNSESYEVAKQKQVIEAERREQKLVNEFVAALTKRKRSVERLRYTSSEGIFYCDVYVSDRGHLIEAKGSTSRGDIRMAIGQLFDYKQLTQKARKRISRLALLLPERPARDLEALLTWLKIGVIWKNGRGFSDNCGGVLVR